MRHRLGWFLSFWICFNTVAPLPGLLAATETGDKTVTMPEVVVKAQESKNASTGSKTDTPVRDIPASVVVIPKQVLEEKSVVTFDEAVKNVSGVTPVMGGNYGFANRYLIRGLAQRFLRDGYTDGPSMNGYYRTMWDVETMEVLKGPGSALYGRGEPGGTINLVTKKPLSDFQGEFSVTGGAFGTAETYLDLGGPLADGLDSRFIAGYQHTDGFRDLERDIWGFLPTVAWTSDENQTWTLDYDFRHIETVPDNYGIVFRNGAVVDVDRETKYYSPFNNTEQEINRATLSHEWSENDDFTLRNAFVADFRELYLLRNAAGTVNNATGAMTGRDAREQNDDAYDLAYQIEVVWKAVTGSWLHTLLAGFEYEKTEIDTVRRNIALPNIANVNVPAVLETPDSYALTRVPNFDRTVSSDTAGLYAQDMIELTEQWKVRGGVRYDNVWFSDDGFSRSGALYPYRLLDFEKGLWSWQSGVVYQPTASVSLYGGVSEGRFINIQTESTSLTEVPEESFQVEGGIKADFFDGRMSANVALFQTERKNYYVMPFGGGSAVPDGQQETYGVEFDVIGELAPGLTLAANLALLDAEFTGDQLSGAVNIKGNDPQSVPESQAALWLQYEFQQPQLKGLGLGVGATYQGSSFADALNVNEVPEYVVGDLAVFYKRENDEIRLSVKNFTDEEYFTHATFAGAAPGEPINISVNYKARF